MEKAVEHGVLHECASNHASMAAMKGDVLQARHELAKEKTRTATLLQEMEEHRVTAKIESDRRSRAKEREQRAEDEQKTMADQLGKALADRSTTEELLMIEQERAGDLSKELTTLHEQRQTIEKIWLEEVSCVRGQLPVQQEWLSTIAVFKLFQTLSFGEFLIGSLESFKAGAITKTLDDVMASHPDLDLTTYESYDPSYITIVDDDLMKLVLNSPVFPFLDRLRSVDRLMSFEEILSSAMDEDEDYRRLNDQGFKSLLHPKSLGLILTG